MRERMISFGLDRAKGFPTVEEEDAYTEFHLGNVYVSRCYNCDAAAIWVYDRMIYPTIGSAPEPNGDMPSDVRADYIEAGSILNLSPRGAAALLRLALQKLCKALGKSGKDLNADIGALVRDGLDQRIQRALDAVRVIGNNAVHPGELNLKDDRPTAETLFKLLNIIVDKMISEPRQMDAIYDALPKGALEAIEKRDAKVK
ncbi:DUF4145 domain-containing protein [Nitratireductor aquimarinus]|uniref:DUF4145 domain-containing protein n=1 Tax=Nitratireductor aquimarinus TaxID=889300 RepID=UPI001A8FB04F|nr:DUF4145 domain-containing protein [Nitratireductor aquimarinus]MBN8243300.1 DUF4145 domain-containing protein [Nitratireductor aquimarinus]MBY6131201.1 DUF4145 domain-containing protein [Nitratireductor aquimarinus]MCA1302043.1 DUF4145 domain-containing protein [Nitratireductor aquimarinus]